MNPLGSPSLDGFPAALYQDHQDIVGSTVYDVVLEVLNDCKWSEGMNNTYSTYSKEEFTFSGY